MTDYQKLSKQAVQSAFEPEHTPQYMYRSALIQALEELGGCATTDDVCERVFTIMQPTLKPGDYVLLSMGPRHNRYSEPRWRNMTKWMRKKLVREGVLKQNSLRGIWELDQ